MFSEKEPLQIYPQPFSKESYLAKKRDTALQRKNMTIDLEVVRFRREKRGSYHGNHIVFVAKNSIVNVKFSELLFVNAHLIELLGIEKFLLDL